MRFLEKVNSPVAKAGFLDLVRPSRGVKISVTASQHIAITIRVMPKKTIVTVVIVGAALALGVVLRTASRADAARSDCFSDSQGPNTPTICN